MKSNTVSNRSQTRFSHTMACVHWSVSTVLCVCILLWKGTLSAADTCSAYRGYPGVPGIPGAHGANGKDGPKGQKGDPGDGAQDLRGQKGDRGYPGNPGRPGLKGDPGIQGPQGSQGKKGEKGSLTAGTQRSFFSYKIPHTRALPLASEPLNFVGPFLMDMQPGQGGESLTNGKFVCKIKGLYFFTFHVSARSFVCLNIKKKMEKVVGFCDYSDGFMLTSGSVVLSLQDNDEVSVQPTEMNSVISRQGADSTFTGFLLYPMK
ncbi:complement C1q subcomponent subunit B [Chanos chanos]|uniref:Complement C1q subcomponent subunit B n=1 Tax=Chanos chanos TaxID=29144 RepID=A0A6J2W1W0_CHACN|nr:complement C1q subcomponent subunit B-like [Chanos chanos]